MLTIAQAAEILGVDPSRVRHLIIDGRLKATKLSDRIILVDEKDLATFQQERRPRGRPKGKANDTR